MSLYDEETIPVPKEIELSAEEIMAIEMKAYRRSVVRAHFACHGVPKGSTYKLQHSWYKEGDLE